MFIGGTGTTTSLLDWEMSDLIKNPHMMKKLKEEAKRVANGKTHITEEELVNMKYLKAVVKETLRLHPPSPLLIPRVNKEETEFNGYHIKAGTQVIINIWAIARDPTNWNDPEEFKPERFMDNPIDVKGNDFKLIPFGSGRRGCPGVVYALAVDEVMLANLVHQFDLEIPGGSETLDMTQSTGLLAHKNTPIISLATPISNHDE